MLISHFSYSSYYCYCYSTLWGTADSQYCAVLKIVEILLLQNLTPSQECNKGMSVVLLSRVAESKVRQNGLQNEYFKRKILIFYTSRDFKHESNKGKLKKIFFSNFYLFNYIYLFNLLSVSSPVLSRF